MEIETPGAWSLDKPKQIGEVNGIPASDFSDQKSDLELVMILYIIYIYIMIQNDISLQQSTIPPQGYGKMINHGVVGYPLLHDISKGHQRTP